MKRLTITVIGCIWATLFYAQQYTGMEGLIHVPSADMDSTGIARIGVHYIPKSLMPKSMLLDGEKFNSANYYVSITPFEWIEFGFDFTLWKFHKNWNREVQEKTGFYSKDRHLLLRIRPLKEGKYWPSVVIGGDDIWGSGDDGKTGSGYFRNYYLAATKHLELRGNVIGTHLTYRKWKRDYNRKWDGLIGGLTFQPAFYHPLRLITEWDGNEVNVGADCRLPLPFAGSNTGLLLQVGLLGGHDLFGGLCLAIDLN